MLSREQILAVDDLPVLALPVPEWNDSVNILTLNAGQRSALTALWVGDDSDLVKSNRARQFMLANAVGGEDKKPLFTEADGPALMAKSGAAIDRIFVAAMNHNGLGATAVDNAAKNSSGAASASSSSASPSASDAPSANLKAD